jgi:hypothetical protein
LWNGRTSKQRLWLGSNPDRGCCRDTATYPASDSYAASNGHSMRSRKPNADADNNAPTANANCYCYCYSYAYCYDTTIPNAYAERDHPTAAQGDTKASPDSASSAVSA